MSFVFIWFYGKELWGYVGNREYIFKGRNGEREIEREKKDEKKRNLDGIKTNESTGYNYRSAILQGYGQVVEDVDEKLVYILPLLLISCSLVHSYLSSSIHRITPQISLNSPSPPYQSNSLLSHSHSHSHY